MVAPVLPWGSSFDCLVLLPSLHMATHEELMQKVFEEVTATGSLQCTLGADGELGMGADGRRALATDNDDRTDTDGEGNTVGIENRDEIGSQYTSTSPKHGRGGPFCGQQGTSNPLFPQCGRTTNPFSSQHGNHSSPFVPHHDGTNTPHFPHHAATNTPPFHQHLRTSPPPFWVMDNPSWGNSGSADEIGSGTFDLGSFTRILETGENCVGAIDGTHVMIRCKKKVDEKRFFSRKGYATQNIMAACNFDLTFVFASAGWEGTYHDYSIFKQYVLNERYRFPRPEAGKYYLVDAGSPNRLGFLAPYKGYRFGFLALMPWYEISTQVDLVLASMAIHNYIRRDRVPDNFFTPISLAYEYAFEDLPDEDPELEDRLDDKDNIVDEDSVPE
ncbi:hypothetical protein RHSIM_Rhsim01G0123300 [Rhododendron simsii]|uniref:DDE Tnp4 domain-containing protein n=1 Tax=Rhododendron simsii TaxID=118357 RepID=A0A834HL46_RHOSS|nr:hypothetical protein RHSIM_Rhsim01G0123300 [Rhododendron simsii]